MNNRGITKGGDMKTMTEERERKIALLKHLKEQEQEESRNILDYEVSSYDDTLFECGNTQYMVLTDNEADEKWDEALDSYLDDCVLPDLPETARMYFDEEKWKNDARMDGRGHSLNYYDGCEWEYEVNGTDYFVYRMN